MPDPIKVDDVLKEVASAPADPVTVRDLAPGPIDYRALIRDRKAKQSRPIVRHRLVLEPELWAELEEAQDALDRAELDEMRDRKEDDEGRPKLGGDRRAGGLTDKGRAQERVEQLAEQIEAVTVVGVFKAPTADEQGAKHDALGAAQEANPDRVNQIVLDSARKDVLDTFQHFETPDRKPIPDLGREDLQDLVAVMAHGELVPLATKINEASTRSHDGPKFGRSSRKSRR